MTVKGGHFSSFNKAGFTMEEAAMATAAIKYNGANNGNKDSNQNHYKMNQVSFPTNQINT